MTVTLCFLALATAASASGHPANHATKPAAVEHVLLIVLENQEADEVAASSGFKDIGVQGAQFTHSSGIAHPSYPNYLALVGVKIHDTPKDWSDRQRDLPDDVPSIVDRVESKGLTWKSYVESYPAEDRSADGPQKCGLVTSKDPYVRRHVPLLSFGNIQHSAARCARIVDASEFDADIKPGGTFPNYAFYTPDLCHDGHGATSCGFGTHDDSERLSAAEKWLTGFLDHMDEVNHDLKTHTLIVVTFDESDNYFPGHNGVFTVFLGGMVKPVRYDQPITHYTVLRTIEDRLGLAPVGTEAALAPIKTVWR